MDRAERQSPDNRRIDGAAHRLPTLSGLSPTYPQAQQQAVFERRSKRGATKLRATVDRSKHISLYIRLLPDHRSTFGVSLAVGLDQVDLVGGEVHGVIDAQQIGCGMAVCDDTKQQIWVCQYEPAGNWVGERPY